METIELIWARFALAEIGMEKKLDYGTLSTKRKADKRVAGIADDLDVLAEVSRLVGLNKVRILKHANERMAERNVIYFELLQALSGATRNPSRDRYGVEYESWQYSLEGKTKDGRQLRIGVSFEAIKGTNERLLIVTVIDLWK